MTTDEQFEIAVRHQVFLERLKSNAARDLKGTVGKLDASIEEVLRGLRIDSVNEVSRTRLRKVLTDLRRTQVEVMSGAMLNLVDDLDELAEYSTEFEQKSLNRQVKGEPFKKGRASMAQREWRQKPMAATGQQLESFFGDYTQAQLKAATGVIQRGHAEGWTIQETVSAYRGTRRNGFRDGVAEVSRRHAEAVVRTGYQHVSQVARNETWKENKDIVKGYKWVSTLDSRTTSLCQSLDGQVFKLGEGPQPPIHIQCRSTTIADMGDKLKFLDEDATRSSEFGPVNANLTYYDWIKTQPLEFQEQALGKSRAALLNSGQLTSKEFGRLNLGRNFKPLTLAEMRNKSPHLFGDSELLRDPVSAITRPRKGTASASIWGKADQFRKDHGRDPSSKELVALLPGLNKSTVTTQRNRWKKAGELTGPTITVPKPKPIDTSRYPKRGSKSRSLWDLADSHKGNKKAYLAAAKAEGFNPSTASVQYGKWQKNRTVGAAPFAGHGPTPSIATKQKQWEGLVKSMNKASEFTAADQQNLGRFGSAVDTLRDKAKDANGRFDKNLLNRHDQRAYDITYKKYSDLWRKRSVLDDKNVRGYNRDEIHGYLRTIHGKPPTQGTLKWKILPSVEDRERALINDAGKWYDKHVPDRRMPDQTLRYKSLHKTGGGGWYQQLGRTININGNATMSTVVHEIGHDLEAHDRAVYTRTRAFIKKRRGKEKLVTRGWGGTKANDYKIFKDKWRERGGREYTSRVYDRSGIHGATEVISCGMERVYKDPLRFYQQDPEHFELTVRSMWDLY